MVIVFKIIRSDNIHMFLLMLFYYGIVIVYPFFHILLSFIGKVNSYINILKVLPKEIILTNS